MADEETMEQLAREGARILDDEWRAQQMGRRWRNRPFKYSSRHDRILDNTHRTVAQMFTPLGHVAEARSIGYKMAAAEEMFEALEGLLELVEEEAESFVYQTDARVKKALAARHRALGAHDD